MKKGNSTIRDIKKKQKIQGVWEGFLEEVTSELKF